MLILEFVGKCLYFMLPAYFANMAPVVAKKAKLLDFLAIPVDGGVKLNGEPLLGTHKTIRGFLTGTGSAIATAYLQGFLFGLPFFQTISLIDYSQYNLFLLGFLMGFGSLVGDSLGSFIKRGCHIKPGSPWIPGDQINLAVGALIFIMPLGILSFWTAISIIFLTFLWHIIAAKTAYYLKIRNEKW